MNKIMGARGGRGAVLRHDNALWLDISFFVQKKAGTFFS